MKPRLRAAASILALLTTVDSGSAQGTLVPPVKLAPVDARTPPVASPHVTTKGRLMVSYEPVPFAALPGWTTDDQLAAFQAFLASSRRLIATAPAKGQPTAQAAAATAIRDVAALALAREPAIKTAAQARAFFEAAFIANRVSHDGPPSLLTAYYEPVIKGARAATKTFSVPIHRRPADLVNLVEESQRGAVGVALTHMRKTPAGLVPYATRAEIDAGALNGQGLELVYLADAVEVFFLQVQGSGQIEFADGTRLRIAYDGKNGHPYTSVGRYLIDQGVMDASKMSLQSLGSWLRADPVRGRAAMQQNKSYVFFREMTGDAAAAPIGVLNIPLTPGRSLAIDPAHHAIGTPIYVSSDALTHATPSGGFHRLMVAQDVGSAIKGPERGDLYIGSGDAAGKIAGITKHPGIFYVLTPRVDVSGQGAAARPTSALPQR